MQLIQVPSSPSERACSSRNRRLRQAHGVGGAGTTANPNARPPLFCAAWKRSTTFGCEGGQRWRFLQIRPGCWVPSRCSDSDDRHLPVSVLGVLVLLALQPQDLDTPLVVVQLAAV
jgi:hypothetical protein